MRPQTICLVSVILFCSCTQVNSQTSFGKRVLDINQLLDKGRSQRLTIGKSDSYDEINRLYQSTEEGPYLNKRWFSATLIAVDSSVHHNPTIKFRYDLYRNQLQFLSKDGMSLVLENYLLKGFLTEDSAFFKLIMFNGKRVLAEMIIDGQYSIAKYYSVKIISEKRVGPSNDGRSNKKFKLEERLIVSNGGYNYQEIQSKVSSLLKVYPNLKSDYKVFEVHFQIKDKEQNLLSFVEWVNQLSFSSRKLN